MDKETKTTTQRDPVADNYAPIFTPDLEVDEATAKGDLGQQIAKDFQESLNLPPSDAPDEGEFGLEPQGDGPIPAPWSPAELPEHMKPEDAYGAAKYFQSERDKIADRLKEERKRIEGIERHAAIAEWLAENPDALSTLQKQLESGDSGGQPMVNPTPTAATAGQSNPRELLASLEPPQPPEKPADYNKEEALYNPDSASAKYDALRDEYPLKMAEYYQKRDQLRDQIETQRQEQLRVAEEQERLRRTQEESIAQTKRAAMYEYGMTQKDADGFLNWITSGEAHNDMAAWVQAYRSRTSTTPTAEDQRRQMTQQQLQQSAANRYPPTAAAAGMRGVPMDSGTREDKSLDAIVDAFNQQPIRF